MAAQQQRSSRPRFWALVVVFALASVVFYTALWPEAPLLERRGDGPSYLESACDLSDGRLDALHDRPPGYPVLLRLLGLCNEPTRTLFVVQLVLHFAALWIMAFTLSLLVESRRLVVAFVLVGTLPAAVAPAAYVRSETLSQLTLVLTISSLVFWLRGGRGAWLLLAAAAAALAPLVRPAYQLLGVALALVLVLVARLAPEHARRARRAAWAVGLVPALVVVAFSLHNEQRFGYFGVTPLFGFNLSTRTVRVLERLPERHATTREILIKHRDQQLVARNGDHLGNMYIWRARDELQAAIGYDRAKLSQHMLRINLLLIRSAPLTYLREVATATPIFWMPGVEAVANHGSRALQLVWAALDLALGACFWLCTLALFGTMSLAATRRGARRLRVPEGHAPRAMAFVLALTVVFYTLAVSTWFEIGNPRYRAPANLAVWFATLVGFVLWTRLRAAVGRALATRHAAQRA